jgi:hypothetical protein
MWEKVYQPVASGAERARVIGRDVFELFATASYLQRLEQYQRQEELSRYAINQAIARIQARDIVRGLAAGEPVEDAGLALKTTMQEHLPPYYELGSLGLEHAEVELLRTQGFSL